MGVNRSVAKSFSYAFDGIKDAVLKEPNFKIHVFMGTIALLLALILGFTQTEWIILAFTIIFVLVLELINTAIEELADLVKPEVSQEVKKVKDLMAAAVLFGAIFAVMIGFFLFLPKIILLF